MKTNPHTLEELRGRLEITNKYYAYGSQNDVNDFLLDTANHLLAALEASEKRNEQKYYMWDSKHKAWWRKGGGGYTENKEEAGMFTAQYIAEVNETSDCRNCSPYPPETTKESKEDES